MRQQKNGLIINLKLTGGSEKTQTTAYLLLPCTCLVFLTRSVGVIIMCTVIFHFVISVQLMLFLFM